MPSQITKREHIVRVYSYRKYLRQFPKSPLSFRDYHAILDFTNKNK
jgi:hypothetical protein